VKKRPQQRTRLNTDIELAQHIRHEYSHKQLLTAVLLYVWNAELDELENLFEEVLDHLPFNFLEEYTQKNHMPRLNVRPEELVNASDASLKAAFVQLCKRAHLDQLQYMYSTIYLLMPHVREKEAKKR
jgi:hypothetical protein